MFIGVLAISNIDYLAIKHFIDSLLSLGAVKAAQDLLAAWQKVGDTLSFGFKGVPYYWHHHGASLAAQGMGLVALPLVAGVISSIKHGVIEPSSVSPTIVSKEYLKEYLKLPVADDPIYFTHGTARLSEFRRGKEKIFVVYGTHASLAMANRISEVIGEITDGESWLFCLEGSLPNLKASKSRFVDDEALVQKAAELGIGIIDPIIGPTNEMTINEYLSKHPNATIQEIALDLIILTLAGVAEGQVEKVANIFIRRLGLSEKDSQDITAQLNRLEASGMMNTAREKAYVLQDSLLQYSNTLSQERISSILAAYPTKNIIFVIGKDHFSALKEVLEKLRFIEKGHIQKRDDGSCRASARSIAESKKRLGLLGYVGMQIRNAILEKPDIFGFILRDEFLTDDAWWQEKGEDIDEVTLLNENFPSYFDNLSLHAPEIIKFARWILDNGRYENKQLVVLGRGGDLIYDALIILAQIERRYRSRLGDIHLVDFSRDSFLDGQIDDSISSFSLLTNQQPWIDAARKIAVPFGDYLRDRGIRIDEEILFIDEVSGDDIGEPFFVLDTILSELGNKNGIGTVSALCFYNHADDMPFPYAVGYDKELYNITSMLSLSRGTNLYSSWQCWLDREYRSGREYTVEIEDTSLICNYTRNDIFQRWLNKSIIYLQAIEEYFFSRLDSVTLGRILEELPPFIYKSYETPVGDFGANSAGQSQRGLSGFLKSRRLIDNWIELQSQDRGDNEPNWYGVLNYYIGNNLEGREFFFDYLLGALRNIPEASYIVEKIQSIQFLTMFPRKKDKLLISFLTKLEATLKISKKGLVLLILLPFLFVLVALGCLGLGYLLSHPLSWAAIKAPGLWAAAGAWWPAGTLFSEANRCLSLIPALPLGAGVRGDNVSCGALVKVVTKTEDASQFSDKDVRRRKKGRRKKQPKKKK